ncbi:hypothetical protein CAEBREN_17242 [Caenorhabditis brenneri]|uniref:Uncharacterized protein n=1 Tax=Caenorhabditis brenneri TaxID=135651 RepID=G0NCZ1_CAEBE|nr:hypothetical protein CAEBREN_17242 [Caenorhabditis brenneri]
MALHQGVARTQENIIEEVVNTGKVLHPDAEQTFPVTTKNFERNVKPTIANPADEPTEREKAALSGYKLVILNQKTPQLDSFEEIISLDYPCAHSPAERVRSAAEAEARIITKVTGNSEIKVIVFEAYLAQAQTRIQEYEHKIQALEQASSTAQAKLKESELSCSYSFVLNFEYYSSITTFFSNIYSVSVLSSSFPTCFSCQCFINFSEKKTDQLCV